MIRKSLKERLRQTKPDPHRHLAILLAKSEVEIDLDHVITALRNHYNKNQYLQKRSQLLSQFLDKALRIFTTTEAWLYEIDQLIEEYQTHSIELPASLYYNKFKCLANLSVSHPKAEFYLKKAIASETNLQNKIDYQIYLAIYYENTSQYQKIRKILDRCEILCRQNPNLDKQLGRTLLYLGHYYFYIFKLDKAADYMNQATNILLAIFQNKEKEEKESLQLLNSCFHYLGRVYLAQYNFAEAAQFYIKAQYFLEKARDEYTLSNDLGATAFYHLRLGQVLEACQLIESADYHYQKSQNIFIDCGNVSGKMQVSLARANLIGSFVDDSNYNKKKLLEKQAQQIWEAAIDAKEIGYSRGYLEALLRIFLLNIKKGKIKDLIKVSFAIITASEFYKFIFSNPNLLISKLQLALGLYGMGPDHEARLYKQKKQRHYTILTACPCDECKCRKLQ
jgi:tetratricopeptide (TPR) repeat protein